MARRKIVAMSRPARPLLALILAVACAVLPLGRAECDASCHAVHASIPSDASCHHNLSLSSKIGRPADACGHDHNAVVQALPEVTSVHKVLRVHSVLEAAHTPHLVHTGRPEHSDHPGQPASHERQLISRFSPIRV
jgi:hypothetical protein